MMDLSMTRGEIEEYLSQPIIARLGTMGKDGYPNVHPLWFIYEDGELIISTMKGSAKIRNIEGNPKAAVAIDTADESQTKGVLFRGKAELVEDESKEITRKILLKYLGTPDHPMYQRIIQMPRTVIKIRPKKTHSWDFAKMQ
jgi:PPOX class probable F420-dependent enzyme